MTRRVDDSGLIVWCGRYCRCPVIGELELDPDEAGTGIGSSESVCPLSGVNQLDNSRVELVPVLIGEADRGTDMGNRSRLGRSHRRGGSYCGGRGSCTRSRCGR